MGEGSNTGDCGDVVDGSDAQGTVGGAAAPHEGEIGGDAQVGER